MFCVIQPGRLIEFLLLFTCSCQNSLPFENNFPFLLQKIDHLLHYKQTMSVLSLLLQLLSISICQIHQVSGKPWNKVVCTYFMIPLRSTCPGAIQMNNLHQAKDFHSAFRHKRSQDDSPACFKVGLLSLGLHCTYCSRTASITSMKVCWPWSLAITTICHHPTSLSGHSLLQPVTLGTFPGWTSQSTCGTCWRWTR